MSSTNDDEFVVMTVKVPRWLLNAIDTESANQHLNRSEFVRRALIFYIAIECRHDEEGEQE